MEEVLPAYFEDLPPEELLQAVWADQRRRWQSGKGVAARIYLERYPTLTANPELAADLVYHEFLVRDELGHAPPFENYLHDYAPYADRLRELHEAEPLLGIVPLDGGADGST